MSNRTESAIQSSVSTNYLPGMAGPANLQSTWHLASIVNYFKEALRQEGKFSDRTPPPLEDFLLPLAARNLYYCYPRFAGRQPNSETREENMNFGLEPGTLRTLVLVPLLIIILLTLWGIFYRPSDINR